VLSRLDERATGALRAGCTAGGGCGDGIIGATDGIWFSGGRGDGSG
jgi:hypothetical protein